MNINETMSRAFGESGSSSGGGGKGGKGGKGSGPKGTVRTGGRGKGK